MDNLEDIMNSIEKRERKVERWSRTSKRIKFLKVMAKKIAALRLQFLLNLFYTVSNYIEYQYSKVYEVYYRFKYRRTIQRFQLLAGVDDKYKSNEPYLEHQMGENDPLAEFYYSESLKKTIQEKEEN